MSNKFPEFGWDTRFRLRGQISWLARLPGRSDWQFGWVGHIGWEATLAGKPIGWEARLAGRPDWPDWPEWLGGQIS